jgi:4-aminobutyrate aminotransferase
MPQDSSEGDLNLSPARRLWAARHAGTQTEALLAADAEVFLHQALSTPCLDVIERAEGSHLITASGRRVLDFHGNSVHQLGHGHPRVVAAIAAQMATLPFCPRRYANRAATELARRLCGIAPFSPARVLFAPSGTAAIGMALKLARAATGRHKTVSMWDSFHGASLDAISVGGEAIFRRDAGPLLPGTEHVPPLGLARRFFGDDRPHERLADYIDYVLGVQGDVACVIAEPMRWTTVEPAPEGFWPRVRDSCDRHGALLIFDEIPSGLGRTGTMFACEQTGCAPDMLVLGKGLGGGIFPLAALLARGALNVAADRALGHYTHEKSSVGCAAGSATLDVIAEEDLVARSARLGRATLAALRSALAGAPGVREVRGTGLYFGVELDRAELADAVMYRCLERDLSFKVGGGTVLTLCPPLTVDEADLSEAVAVVAESLRPS